MRVLVIGASGYLGRYIVAALRNREHTVVAFDLDTDPGLRARAREDPGLTVVTGDMTSFVDLADTIQGHDITDVIQLAYFGTPENGLLDSAEARPYDASKTNTVGFNNVLEGVRQFGLDSLVWASSTVVYGRPGYYEALGIDTVDESSPTDPNSLYGACKVKNEYIAGMYREEYGIDIAGIRLPLIYGPERYPGAQPFVVELFEEAAAGGAITLTDGETTWDLLYERDVGPLFATLVEAGEYAHGVYNVVGHTVTVAELAALAEQYGAPEAEVTVDSGADPVLPTPLEDSRIRQEFDVAPRFDVETAVADYIDTLRAPPRE